MTQYLYDAGGNRIGQGTITQWSCDIDLLPNGNGFQLTKEYVLGQGGEQITEFDGSSNWVHTNAYAGGQLIATYDTAGYDTAGRKHNYANPARHYQLADWLGTRRMQVTPEGIVEGTFQSLPFGDEFTPALTNVATADDATEHHFTGKERDTESGLDLMGARYYASTMGRFISPDPSQLYYADPTNPQSLNLYSYALNNPLTNADPTGLYCIYYKNNFGNPNDIDSIDNNSSYSECEGPDKNGNPNGGQWVEDSSVEVNANDGDNSAPTTTVTPGQLPNSPTVNCVGIARGLAGVKAPFPKKGGAFNYGKNPVTVTAGTAAVIPSQFRFQSNLAMKPFVGEISGNVGTNHFSSVTDSIDNAVSPVAGLSTPAAFQQLNPGRLIVEITAAPDVGKNALVDIAVPRSMGCPANTVEAK